MYISMVFIVWLSQPTSELTCKAIAHSASNLSETLLLCVLLFDAISSAEMGTVLAMIQVRIGCVVMCAYNFIYCTLTFTRDQNLRRWAVL